MSPLPLLSDEALAPRESPNGRLFLVKTKSHVCKWAAEGCKPSTESVIETAGHLVSYTVSVSDRVHVLVPHPLVP